MGRTTNAHKTVAEDSSKIHHLQDLTVNGLYRADKMDKIRTGFSRLSEGFRGWVYHVKAITIF